MQSENLIAGHNKQEITVIKSQAASKASLTKGQRCRNKLLPCLRPKKHYTGGPWLLQISLLRSFKTFQKYLSCLFLGLRLQF
jgi:hypothetical protein